MTIKGRFIFDESKNIIGKIVGNRPSVNDIYKGASANFAIIWADGRREMLDGFCYFADACKYVKSKYAQA